jgi:L-iditol 2-dehydrogenase
MSVPGVTGAFQEYVAWPANLVYKLPENVDTMAGCLVEPLAVGFHSVFQSGAKIGDTAVILGCGCIGICCLMGLRAIGVHDVYMVDLSQVRLEKAMQCGAKAVYNGKDVDIAQKIMELTNGRGADVVFECTGVASQGDKAIECICKGGMVQFVGLHATNVVPINLNGLIFKEGKVNTTFRYRHVYPIVIKAIAAGIAPIKDIVSHTFKFEELDHAIDFNINNKDAVTKIVIEL